MESFKLTGVENNSLNISDSVTIGPSCEISFPLGFGGKESINNEINLGEDSRFRFFRIIIRGSNNKVHIGSNTSYTGTIMIEGSSLNVTIGDGCTVNGLFITCRDQDVMIGSDCLISSEVKIRSSDSHKIFDLDGETQINKPQKPVSIGNHVWIGQDVYIGKNSSIANGCIVAARATVTKRIDKENCVIAEYSKIIKENIRWEK